LARSEAHVLRLAAIYAMLDGIREVVPAHLRAARAVVDYCADSTAYIFRAGTGDRIADKILDALRARPDGMTRWQLLNDVFQRNLATERLTEALALLEQMGKIASQKVQGAKGRPAVRYVIWYEQTR